MFFGSKNASVMLSRYPPFNINFLLIGSNNKFKIRARN